MAMVWLVLLFLIVTSLLGVVLYLVWRYWDETARLGPDDEDYERKVAALNERQANRLSDDQLLKQPDENEAWTLMVERGRRARQGSRRAEYEERRAAIRRARR